MSYKLLSSVFYSDNDKYEELYTNRLNSESAYKFNFKVGGYNAFVIINHDILQKIEQIMETNKKLFVNMSKIPPIALKQYTQKCLVDEIKMTNEIEGVNSTRKEINEILKDKTDKKIKKRLYGIVKKYELMTKEDIKLDTCHDIRELYNELVLKDVVEEDGENAPDGSIFRKDNVFIQNPTGKKIHKGVYPEEDIISTMTECLSILKSDDYDFLICTAVFHYMFGYIHPFYDGNGRMSRFISSYLLTHKLEFLVSYRLSYTIKQNVKSYYKSFKITNDEKNRGDLTSFTLSFFDILITSLTDLCKSLEERYNKLEFFTKIVEKICDSDKLMFEVLFILVQNTLFGDEGLSIQELYEIADVGVSKIRKSIKELDEVGILNIKKSGRTKLYDINLDKMSEFAEI